MNNRGIPPTSSILWFQPSMLHGYVHIFLLWLKSTTTKYLELPSAKGEEGSRDGDAERANT